MKKFLTTITICLAMMLSVQVEAAAPARDTWVLNWEGTDLYVKAGSLDYTPGHPDAAPEFGFVLFFDGGTLPCYFRSRGYAVLYVYGEAVGDSRSDNFVNALYNAVCNKLIYHR